MDVRYSKILKWFYRNHKDRMDRLVESLSENQIICKKWLIESLDEVDIPRDENGQFKIEIVGCWFGFPLIQFLNEKYGDEIKEIMVYEVDRMALIGLWRYLEIFDLQDKVKYRHKDYFEEDRVRRAHLVINTSCEHMPNMSTMKDRYVTPERTLLVLQSNDKINEPDHTNCVKDCAELTEQAGIKELFADKKKMNMDSPFPLDRFTRFMVMGKWK